MSSNVFVMIMISNFLFNILYFGAIFRFLTKSVTFGILFLTAVNAELVAKPVILDILFFISVILELYSVFLTKPLVSGFFFSKSDLSVSNVVFKTNPVVSMLSTFVTNLLYSVFLTTSFFTASLSLAN